MQEDIKALNIRTRVELSTEITPFQRKVYLEHFFYFYAR